MDLGGSADVSRATTDIGHPNARDYTGKLLLRGASISSRNPGR